MHPNLSVFSKQCDKELHFTKNRIMRHMYHIDGSKTKVEKRKRRKKKELYEINTCLIED